MDDYAWNGMCSFHSYETKGVTAKVKLRAGLSGMNVRVSA